MSRGARSPARRRSPHPGCLSPLGLGPPRRPSGRRLSAPGAVNPSPTWKCGLWLPRKSPPRPGGAPYPSPLRPACRLLAPHFPERPPPPRRTKVRQESKFKRVPHASLATVEALGEPARPPRGDGGRGSCAGGADPRWILRSGQARRELEAEGGAETHPRGRRGCGDPCGPLPPASLPGCGPAAAGWLGWAGSLSGSFY